MLSFENQNIEFKQAYVPDIRKEVMGFANAEGGTVYIGVRKDGAVVGVDDPDGVMLQVVNSLKDSLSPDVMPFIKTGGLADVVGTLPKIFDRNEYDVRVIMPNYLCIPNKYREKMQYLTVSSRGIGSDTRGVSSVLFVRINSVWPDKLNRRKRKWLIKQ